MPRWRVVAAQNHETTVTWTLSETAGGTRLQLEQTGFAVDAKQELGGARHAWGQMLDQLRSLLATTETRPDTR